MPSKFEIYKRISRGTRKGHEQVVVMFQGNSVTRHLINGVGRHPDDTIPGLHKNLSSRIEENQRLTADKKAAIARIQEMGQKPKNLDEVMRQAALEMLGLRGKFDKAKAAELVAKMQREIKTLEEALPVLKSALAAVQKEDPLMVNYF